LESELQDLLKLLISSVIVLKANIWDQEASIKVKVKVGEELELDFNVKVKIKTIKELKLDFNVNVNSFDLLIICGFVEVGRWKGVRNCNQI
jgi:hypothetical protein